MARIKVVVATAMVALVATVGGGWLSTPTVQAQGAVVSCFEVFGEHVILIENGNGRIVTPPLPGPCPGHFN